MPFPTDLPIKEALPELLRALAVGKNAVLDAPPGAGKTTIVPLALLDEPWLKGGRIVMLEPRRLAARASAERMASLLGEEAGGTVGYRTRFDSRVGPSTRIEVLTEGILTRFLQNDPSLEGIGVLIFDEFHERSIHADLGLALALEAQSLLRSDLRILVMSATLDGEELSALIGNAPIIRSVGRAFPVEVRYLSEARGERAEPTGPAFTSKVVAAVFKSIKEESGSILVFLPGAAEIRRIEAALKEKSVPEGVDVVPLYGELARDFQDFAIRPSRAGRRKVVLATTIAETSLTIEGVSVVIDGGLKRVPRFDPSIGMGTLATVRVTKDSAEQRRGRAGRLSPGVCVRLWSESENAALLDKGTPEIMEADLTPLALELAIWGVKDPGRLKWLDPPPQAGMAHAKEVLERLGAIDREGRATPHGSEIARLPLHPRLAHMAVKARELALGNLACHLASLLAERDIFKAGPGARDSDIRLRLEYLLGMGHVESQADRALSERVRAAARQLRKQLDIKDSSKDVDEAGFVLALAYPDRVAKRRAGAEGKYLLASGRGAYFRGPESLSREEYVVAAHLGGSERESAIFLAAPLKEADLLELFAGDIEETDAIEWDQAELGVVAKRRRRFWNLVLTEAPIKDPSKERLLEALLSGIRLNGINVLAWDRSAMNLRERINFLHGLGKETGVAFPELTDEWLLNNLESWLGPCLSGMTRLHQLKRLDLRPVILGLLTWAQREALDRLAPTHVTVPSGSRVPVDYSGERPSLSVRLQEMFGLDKTPAIANGRVNLVLHLLSPAHRPVQVTEDLAGFWARGYQAVKKELRGRYPKHYWPDDPMVAEPARGVRRKKGD